VGFEIETDLALLKQILLYYWIKDSDLSAKTK